MAKTKSKKVEEELKEELEEVVEKLPEGFDPSLPEAKQRWLRS